MFGEARVHPGGYVVCDERWWWAAGDDRPAEDAVRILPEPKFQFVVDVGGSVNPGQKLVQVVIPGDFLRRSAGESRRL